MYRALIIPFLYICVLILLPLLITLITPFLIYRRIVARLCQLFGDASIGKILNAAATSHACIGGKVSNILPITVEGVPDLAHIKAQFTEKILNAKDPATGDGPLYPELSQTIVSWGGYFFWADIPNFTLPIRLLNIDPIDIDSNEGINLLRNLYNREWKFGQEAFWELVIVPGVGGKFCLVFVTHHALGDALSVKKMLNKVFQPPIVEEKVKFSTPERQNTVVSLVKTMLKIPYDFSIYLEALLRTTILRRGGQVPNSGNVPVMDKLNLGMTICTKSTNLATVKKIAAGHSVSVSAILISAVQGSIQKCGDAKGLLYLPLPTAVHSEKLRNVGGIGYIELLQNGNGREKLERTEEQLRQIKSSTFPWMSTFTANLTGSLPPFLLRRTIRGAATAENLRTYAASIFVAWRHPTSLFGYPVTKIGSVGSGLAGTNAVAFFMFSSHDMICVSVMGDSKILSEREGTSLLDGMLGEVEILGNLLDTPGHIKVTIM